MVKVLSVKYAAAAVLCEPLKDMVNLGAHQDGGSPSTGILEILETEASNIEI
jgi:hypothetical protein